MAMILLINNFTFGHLRGFHSMDKTRFSMKPRSQLLGDQATVWLASSHNKCGRE